MGVKFRGNNFLKVTLGMVVVGAALTLAYENCGGDFGPLGNSGLSSGLSTTLGSSSSGGGSTSTTPASYQSTILSDQPSYYWRLGDQTGTLQDLVGGNTATITGSYTLGLLGAIVSDSNAGLTTGSTFSLTTALSVTASPSFSYEFWFKSTNAGGIFVGFGNQQSDSSSIYDLQMFMADTGTINLGIFTNTAYSIGTTGAYNNGGWHHVVGAFTNGSIPKIYIDGALVVTGTTTSAAGFTGYVHIANDNCSGWSNSPTNCSFIGELDEVAIYPRELTASQVSNHYRVGTGH